MQWVPSPIFQLVVVLASILPESLDTSLASVWIDPGSTEHPPRNVNAVENAQFWNNNGINAESCQRLNAGSPSRKLPDLYVVWEVVVAVLPAVLDALVVQDLGVMFQSDAA